MSVALRGASRPKQAACLCTGTAPLQGQERDEIQFQTNKPSHRRTNLPAAPCRSVEQPPAHTSTQDSYYTTHSPGGEVGVFRPFCYCSWTERPTLHTLLISESRHCLFGRPNRPSSATGSYCAVGCMRTTGAGRRQGECIPIATHRTPGAHGLFRAQLARDQMRTCTHFWRGRCTCVVDDWQRTP